MGARFLINSDIYHYSKYLAKNSRYILSCLEFFVTSDCERNNVFKRLSKIIKRHDRQALKSLGKLFGLLFYFLK